jgi:hypothetical protein
MKWLKVGVDKIPDGKVLALHAPDENEPLRMVYYQSAQWNGFEHGLWIRLSGVSEPVELGDLFYPLDLPQQLPRTNASRSR